MKSEKEMYHSFKGKFYAQFTYPPPPPQHYLQYPSYFPVVGGGFDTSSSPYSGRELIKNVKQIVQKQPTRK